jgi:hypothetical protein
MKSMLAPVPPAAIESSMLAKPSTRWKLISVGLEGKNWDAWGTRSAVGVSAVRTIQ